MKKIENIWNYFLISYIGIYFISIVYLFLLFLNKLLTETGYLSDISGIYGLLINDDMVILFLIVSFPFIIVINLFTLNKKINTLIREAKWQRWHSYPYINYLLIYNYDKDWKNTKKSS